MDYVTGMKMKGKNGKENMTPTDRLTLHKREVKGYKGMNGVFGCDVGFSKNGKNTSANSGKTNTVFTTMSVLAENEAKEMSGVKKEMDGPGNVFSTNTVGEASTYLGGKKNPPSC
ncbi:hypothetical protein KY333_05155 [Candidatus Woesearchaeota archaeon]|nr:hypothetical protein [Candidatus Woesearchaeota archaeon]